MGIRSGGGGGAFSASQRRAYSWNSFCSASIASPAYRMCRKHARSSFTNIAGCSNAAKWPPRSSSFQYTRFVKRFSAQRRDDRKISFGKMLQPVGAVTGVSNWVCGRKLSQYKRADEAPVAGSQYSI